MNKSDIKNILQLLFLLVLINCVNNAAVSEAESLYSPQDDVNVLTSTTIKKEIYGNKRAWLVEFYNSWCGFCKRFAPSWKEMGTDVKDWSDLVAIGAIDCANEDNNLICREFEVMSYPTLRYFHENFQESTTDYGLPLLPLGKVAEDHRHKLIETIIAEQISGRAKHYPNLIPYNYTDTSHVFDSVLAGTNFVFLVVQQGTSYLGQEVSLDLHRIREIVVKNALSNNTDLLSYLKISEASAPSLFVINKEKTVEHLVTDTPTREGFKTVITEFLKTKHISIPDSIPQPDVNNNAKPQEVHIAEKGVGLQEKVKSMGDAVFQMDLETALRYSLKREVAGRKEISGEQLEALKKYLIVLVKYFPLGRNGKKLLHNIQEYIATSSPVRGIEIGMMVKQAEKPEKEVFSTQQQWLACKGSTPTHRGYPCGLWKMFHYLTVNVAEGEQKIGGSNPRLALEAMHGYIKNFFSCTDCSQHFQEMAARRELGRVSSFDDSILWLWQAHNEVNDRLHGDETEDPEFPKIQYPSKTACSQCYNNDNSWNNAEVLQYLKRVYRSTSIRYLEADTRVLDLVPNGSDSWTKSESPSSFKMIDTSVLILAAAARGLVYILVEKLL